MPTKLTPRGPQLRCTSSSTGIIATHGGHQVAQKSSTTTWPRRLAIVTAPGVPSMRGSEKSGAIWPLRMGRRSSMWRALHTACTAAIASVRPTIAALTARAPLPAAARRRRRARCGGPLLRRGRLGRGRVGLAAHRATGAGRARATRTARHTSTTHRRDRQAVGHGGVELARPGQRAQRALQAQRDEVGRVAGGGQLEIPRRVPLLARQHGDGDRRRQHEPRRLPHLDRRTGPSRRMNAPDVCPAIASTTWISSGSRNATTLTATSTSASRSPPPSRVERAPAPRRAPPASWPMRAGSPNTERR